MKKKMLKGFTLIELLAVIVILGIIAVISVPVVSNVIGNSRKEAFRVSTLNLFHAYTNYEAEHGFEIKEEIDFSELDITNKSTFQTGKIYRNETDSVKVENVSNGIYCASGTQENLKIVEGTCDLLDETPPEIVSVTTDVTTNSIKLYTSYQEEEGYISKHEYRIAMGNENIEEKEWVSGDTLTENLSTKTFSNLGQGGSYKIQIRLTNTALENNVSDIYELEVTTLALEKPVITLLTTEEYATSKEIMITYPEGSGFIYEYSLDGTNWKETSEKEKTITIEENSIIKARVSDGTNVMYADALTIGGIDKTKPVVTITKNVVENKNVFTFTIEPISTLSGYRYTWYKDGKEISGQTSTLTTTESGTYQLKVTTGAGVESVSNEITIHSYTITYHLNGGEGSIPNGIKIEDLSTSITSTIPTRAGYSFVGWGITSMDKEPTYASGATYTKNENITLYAIFKKEYTITFVENGATLSKKTESCEIYNAETSCTITTPTITAQTNFTQQGFGSSSGSTSATIAQNTDMTLSNTTTGGTYYALNSRTVSWNFNKNTVSNISATSRSCTIWSTSGTCSITTPTITAQTNFTQQGFGATTGSTSMAVAQNASMTLSNTTTGGTYYALNSRVVNWNFNKNTVSSISATSRSCTIWSTSGTCTITTPTITAQTNFTQQGFGTATGSTSATVAQNTAMSLSNTTTGGTYYALNSRRLTWNFNKGSVSSISKTTDGCTIWSTGATCTISAPTITPVSGYTQNGFGTSNTATSATVAQSGTITLSNTSTGGTYYGLQKKTITITYNGNEATGGSTASQTCTMYNESTTCAVTLNANGFTKTNYEFLGWGAGTDAVTYNAGTSYTYGNSATLYAIWKSAANFEQNRTTCTAEANEAGTNRFNYCMNQGGTEGSCSSSAGSAASYAYSQCCIRLGGCGE